MDGCLASKKKEARPNRSVRGPRVLGSTRLVGLLRPPVDSDRAEARGTGRLRRPVADFLTPGDLEVLESCSGDHRLELCFQQSARDSTSPEVDSLLGLRRDRTRHEDVGDLQSPSGP